MINPNELRIGNRVLVDRFNDDEPWETIVEEIEPYQITVALIPRGGTRVKPDEIEPITLTAEWLERLDYKKNLLDGKYYKQGSVLPPLYWINECRWGMSTLPVTGHHIQYVHQLQNIYLDLTGEELNVKL